jgi:hypothetical protein
VVLNLRKIFMALEASGLDQIANNLFVNHQPEVMLMASLQLWTRRLHKTSNLANEKGSEVLGNAANRCIDSHCKLMNIDRSEVDAAYADLIKAGELAHELASLPA